MPIDPDAYMSGAIPTLSRGASWGAPSDHSQSLDGTDSQNCGKFRLFSGASFVPSASIWNSLPYSSGTQGWFTPGTESSHGTSATPTPLGHPSCVGLMGQTRTLFVDRMEINESEPAPDEQAPRLAGDFQDSPCASMLGRTRSTIRPMVYRRKADNLPSPPPRNEKWNINDDSEHIGKHRGSVTCDDHLRCDLCCHRSAKNRIKGKLLRETAHDHLKRSPPRLKTLARISRLDIGASPTVPTVPSPPLSAGSPGSPYRKLDRPSSVRRYTSNETIFASSADNHKQSKLVRERHVSAPSPQCTASRATSASPSLSASRSAHKNLDLTSLRSMLDTCIASPPLQVSESFKREPSTGYISPTANVEYCRYAAHPAVSERVASGRRSSDQLLPCNDPRQPEAYIPIGYARPTKELAWNRDGPAMKTYGVAWKRHHDDMVLPSGPAGPRWIQARPPQRTQANKGESFMRGQ